MPVFFLGTRSERLRPALWGFAAGSMGVVSIVGLLAPALDEGSAGQAALGLAIGIVFMLSARRYLQVHRVRVRGRDGERVRSSVLVFAVLFVHSFPEGLAIGTAYASDTAGLSLFVIVAIALQNIPEGTSVAIPMAAAGFGRAQQFWAAVVTSVPQPIAAVLAYRARRRDRRAAAGLVRVCGRSDALAGSPRGVAGGARAAGPGARDRGSCGGSRLDAGFQRGAGRLRRGSAAPARGTSTEVACRFGTGSRALSSVPAPGVEMISSRPPARATRSRIPTRPKPPPACSGSKPAPSSETVSSTAPLRRTSRISTR